MIKVDDRGYATQYDKDGKIVAHYNRDDMLMLHRTFENRYWPYAKNVVDPNVEEAAKAAFIEAWGYYKEAFERKLRAMERKYDRLCICHHCQGPRFKDEYCTSNSPGCDL